MDFIRTNTSNNMEDITYELTQRKNSVSDPFLKGKSEFSLTTTSTDSSFYRSISTSA